MSKIFMSYRRDDVGGYAHAVCSQLVHHFSKDRVFMDVDTIEPGVDFVTVIEETLRDSDVLVALIGERWAGMDNQGKSRLDDPRDYVRLEISTAPGLVIRVIPVLFNGVTMPSAERMAGPLESRSRRNGFEIRHTRFNRDMELLITAVRKVLDTAEERRKVEEERTRVAEEERKRAEQEAERRRLEAERKAEEQRLQEKERKRSEEEARRKAEEENRRHIEEERTRTQQEAERRRIEAEAQQKEEERLRERELERQR